jgi:MinD superfamily P-loop ATPase
MEIAVISGKGGTGKSSICAAFAMLSEKVVAVDCDVDAANLYLIFEPNIEEEKIYLAGQTAFIDYEKCVNCGICINYCRFDAIELIENIVKISGVSCDGCGLCHRICPQKAISMEYNDQSRMYAGTFRNGKMVYGRLAPGEENSGKLVNLVREKAKEIAKENKIETIIIDGPPGIGCPVISTITGVDKIVIITEPTKSGLEDLKRTIEMANNFSKNIFIVVNKYDLNENFADEIKNYCKTENVIFAGQIPFEKKIVEAMVNCKTIIEYDNNCQASMAIQRIYNNILLS